MRSVLKLAVAICVSAGIAAAQSFVSTKAYNIPTWQSEPQGITSGPDGALWFTENHGNKIGRITTAGSITEFIIPTAASNPFGITTGPDSALWFTESSGNKIGRITTSGVFSEYPVLTASASPTNIVSGPDGALWFTEQTGNSIGRITTNGTVTEYLVPTPASLPYGIAGGPDGAIWFTEANAYQIGRADISGLITEYQPPSVVPSGDVLPPMYAITAGPGGLWFISGQYPPNTVGRVTTSGSFTNYDIAPQLYFQGPFYGIVAGPDGALWFTAFMGEAPGSDLAGIGRITTTGAVSQYFTGGATGFPEQITVGPDGALWFTAGIGSIGRITLSALSGPVITTMPLPIATALSPYSEALTATGGTPPYTWTATSGLPAGLTLSSQGILSGTPLSYTPSQTFTVMVTDAASETATAAFSLTIIPAQLQITTTTLPAGTINMPYSQTLTVTKGTPPYLWGVQSGSLPPGLVFSGAGAITGAPTIAGLYTFSVLVEDHNLNSATQSFSILIQGGCSAAISSSGQTFGASGGSGSVAVTTGASCSWNVTGVPAWMTITGGASGNGPGSVSYTVAPNSATTRSGTLSIDGLPYTIQQAGPALSFVGSMPHLAAEGGWNTTFTIVNKGSNLAQTEVDFFNDAGGSLGLPLTFPQQPSVSQQTESLVDATIPADGSLILEASGPANVPFVEGSAQILAQGGTSVDGFAIFHYDPSQQEAVVPLETRNAASYVLPFDNTNGVLTGVAVENLSSSTATIPVVIRDTTGAIITSGTLDPLGQNGHASFVLSTHTPITGNIAGTIEFDTPGFGSSNAGQISVLGIRYTPPGTMTTIPALANVGTNGGSTAHLAVGGGWQTTFVLVNTGTSAATANLNFYDDDGNPLGVAVSFPQSGIALATRSAGYSQSIWPGASLWVQVTGTTAALQTGSAQLTTTGNFGGFAILRYNTNGQEAVVPLESRNASSYLIAFDNTEGVATGVAIANASGQAVTIPVTLRDTMGNSIGTSSIALGANGHTSFVLSQMFPQTANLYGTVEFDTPGFGTANAATISVLGIRSPPALTFTTLPALAK